MLVNIIKSPVKNIAEVIQLVTEIFHAVVGEFKGDERLCLTAYAADVLSAVYRAVVLAACDIALLSADDSANVIACVLIAYNAVVDAVLNRTVGEACNAADVCHIHCLFGGSEVVNADVLETESIVLRNGSIHMAVVGAAEHDT